MGGSQKTFTLSNPQSLTQSQILEVILTARAQLTTWYTKMFNKETCTIGDKQFTGFGYAFVQGTMEKSQPKLALTVFKPMPGLLGFNFTGN